MSDVLAGIRVLEVATWTFVPSACAVLAEWGADVIKVEDPVKGDPQRALISSMLMPVDGINFLTELPNRGKRSVGIDIKSAAGRELLVFGRRTRPLLARAGARCPLPFLCLKNNFFL